MAVSEKRSLPNDAEITGPPPVQQLKCKPDTVVSCGKIAAETDCAHIKEFKPDCTGKYFITGGLGALGIEVGSIAL